MMFILSFPTVRNSLLHIVFGIVICTNLAMGEVPGSAKRQKYMQKKQSAVYRINTTANVDWEWNAMFPNRSSAFFRLIVETEP
jgi:hypothetical protein